jgi:hypothetical protein
MKPKWNKNNKGRIRKKVWKGKPRPTMKNLEKGWGKWIVLNCTSPVVK